jgi:hypothetical protein
MEKISKILPPTRRTGSYSINEAKPVRPGAPSFGGPEALTSQEREKLKAQSPQEFFKEAGIYNSKGLVIDSDPIDIDGLDQKTSDLKRRDSVDTLNVPVALVILQNDEPLQT